MDGLSSEEKKQKEHYDNIIDIYERHYDDKYSKIYRDFFINRRLFEDVKLYQKKVLEAMCGSGQTTPYLLKNAAKVYALDISEEAIKKYSAKFPSIPFFCNSILNTRFKDESFDVVVILGGLHHLHPSVDKGIKEVHRILKKEGHFCFLEPNSESVLDKIRKIWYKNDGYFADNEKSINVQKLIKDYESMFCFEKVFYKGSLAYFLVFNSMIFRIPKFIKKIISPPLLFLEKKIDFMINKYTSGYAICICKKKTLPEILTSNDEPKQKNTY